MRNCNVRPTVQGCYSFEIPRKEGVGRSRHPDEADAQNDQAVLELRLAERDFKPIWDVEANEKCVANPDFGSLVYLTGIFWGRIERIRQDGMSVVMGRDARGKKLQSFFNCLESRRVRIIDRIQQRAIGECLLSGRETKSYTEFVNAFERDEPNLPIKS